MYSASGVKRLHKVNLTNYSWLIIGLSMVCVGAKFTKPCRTMQPKQEFIIYREEFS